MRLDVCVCSMPVKSKRSLSCIVCLISQEGYKSGITYQSSCLYKWKGPLCLYSIYVWQWRRPLFLYRICLKSEEGYHVSTAYVWQVKKTIMFVQYICLTSEEGYHVSTSYVWQVKMAVMFVQYICLTSEEGYHVGTSYVWQVKKAIMLVQHTSDKWRRPLCVYSIYVWQVKSPSCVYSIYVWQVTKTTKCVLCLTGLTWGRWSTCQRFWNLGQYKNMFIVTHSNSDRSKLEAC